MPSIHFVRMNDANLSLLPAALNMYRPSAVTLARFLIDLPLIAFQHVLFILPFYFLSGLQINAGKFFFFYLTMYISTVCFSNLLRMFAYYVPSLDDCKSCLLKRPTMLFN